MPKLQKFNSLLNTIRNPNRSIQERESALSELERQTNNLATRADKKLQATLENFETQWARFENNLERMDEAFAFLDNDIDDTEVNELMQQIQDEVQLDKKWATTNARRPSTPKKFNPNAASPITEDFINDLKKLAEESENARKEMEKTLNLSVEEEFQLALDSLTGENLAPKTAALSPPQNSRALLYKEIPSHPMQTRTNNVSDVSNSNAIYQPQKTNLFDAFIKHLVGFAKSVSQFFQKNYASPSSLEKMNAQLKNAQHEIKSTKNYFDNTKQKLLKNIEQREDKKSLLENKNVIFNQLFSLLNDLNKKTPTKENPHLLKQQVKSIDREYKKTGQEVQRLARQLNRVNEKIAETSERLVKVEKAHLLAEKTLNHVMQKLSTHLENGTLQKQSIQEHFKEALQKSKKAYQQHESLSNAGLTDFSKSIKPKP